MAELKNYIQYTKSRGRSVQYGDQVLTPISQALTVRLPFWGYVWNRPVAIEIDDGESIEKIPIVDVTLMARIGLFGIGIAAGLLTIAASRSRR